jgi:hypothetical protein
LSGAILAAELPDNTKQPKEAENGHIAGPKPPKIGTSHLSGGQQSENPLLKKLLIKISTWLTKLTLFERNGKDCATCE